MLNYNYLNGFDKRMEFVACISSIVNRKNTNIAMENLFDKQKHELDNIIISMLVHIMEKTLFEEDDCTIDELEMFLAQLVTIYKKKFSPETLHELTRYIVKDILQNKNENYVYYVMDYSKGEMQSQSVRLIADRITSTNKVVYFLTTQGYNMLLRTKEVDDVLGFQIEKVRLKMLVQSRNYSKALEQTKQLIRMLNEKSNELRLFDRKLHLNIYTASGDECESIIQSISNMILDEYNTLEDVQNNIVLYRKHLTNEGDEDETTTDSNSELSTAREKLFNIDKNIDIIFQKQRTLLTECMKLRNVYFETVRLALTTRSVHRFDLQEVVLSQLERYDHTNTHTIDEICAKLLAPLMFPKFPSILDIGLFYAPQLQREDSNEEDTLPDGDYIQSDSIAKRIDKRNSAHVTVITLLLQYAQSSGGSFFLSELWEYYLEHSDVTTLTHEKLIFLVFLQLYELGTIDIKLCKGDPHECQGEFDLSYALSEIYTNHPDMFGIRAIHIAKSDNTVQLSWQDTSFGLPCEQKVEINNLKFTREMN